MALDRIGLRRVLLSDDPSGARGEVWDERSPSLNRPSATALPSSWDPAADVAVVVVGTNFRVESEGFDLADLALPGKQDELRS